MLLDSQQAYDHLTRKIFSGELPPGSKLIERDLAEQLNISRMPVRIALSQMVAQGVVVGGQKQRSVRVRQYSPGEVAQLYQFREVVECGAVRAASERADTDDLAQLRQICDDMQDHVGCRRVLSRWAELDRAFHEAIAVASDNEWFCSINKMLLQQTHYVLFRVRGHLWSELQDHALNRRMQAVVDVHRRIVSHIQVGDADGAEHTMRDHVRMSFQLGTTATPCEPPTDLSTPPESTSSNGAEP